MSGLHKLWKKLNRAFPGLYVDPAIAFGEYFVYLGEGTDRRLLFHRENLLLYTWGWIAARCIALGDQTYTVGSGYIEYQNSATAGTVPVPSFTRGDYTSYYSGLTGGKDYIRTSLSATPTLDQSPDYVSLLPTGSVNRATFQLTAVDGAKGTLGSTFSNAQQSVAYGIALVATPLWTDLSKDVILSRGYFLPGDQVAVPSSGQIQVDWLVAFR